MSPAASAAGVIGSANLPISATSCHATCKMRSGLLAALLLTDFSTLTPVSVSAMGVRSGCELLAAIARCSDGNLGTGHCFVELEFDVFRLRCLSTMDETFM